MYLINLRYLGVVKIIDIYYYVYIWYVIIVDVINLEIENYLEYCYKKLLNYVSVENLEKRENVCL